MMRLRRSVQLPDIRHFLEKLRFLLRSMACKYAAILRVIFVHLTLRINWIYVRYRVINTLTKNTSRKEITMKKTNTKTTFRMNGWIYTYNESMTSNWGWPEGLKGQRVRILKKQMQQLLKEREAFKMAYTEI